MAFNPFASFRKHQKYWMAGAVLVCMLTFVLCSGGMKGTGLDDLLLGWTRRRGEDYLTINKRGYSYEEINQLKEQRNVANDFMREATKLGMEQLQERVKTLIREDSKEKDKLLQREIFQTCMGDLYTKLTRDPRYFHGGTTVNDLIEFLLWRDLADKYNIQLTDDMVKELVMQNLHGSLWGFDSRVSLELEWKVRSSHAGGSAGIFKAVKDEFRVQIVQLAVLGHWSPNYRTPRGWDQNDAAMPDMIRDLLADRYNIFLNTPMDVRVAPTPEQISAHYRKVRTELTVQLLPVSLADLAKQEKLPEDKTERLKVLKEFYDKYAGKEYNPTLETPGFTFPVQVIVKFVAADASMPYYKVPAEALSRLEKTPPVALSPLTPLTGELGWLAFGPGYAASLEEGLKQDRSKHEAELGSYHKVLDILNQRLNEPLPQKSEEMTEFILRQAEVRRQYDDMLARRKPGYKYSLSGWLTPYFWNDELLAETLKKPKATTAAAAVAALARPDGVFAAAPAYQSAAYDEQFQKLKPMLAIEKTKRIQVGTELVLAQLPNLTPSLVNPAPFTAAALTYYAGNKEQYMPVAGYLEDELRNKVEERRAQEAVNKVMLDVKARLEAVKAREATFQSQYNTLRNKYSREIQGVDKAGNKTRMTVYGFEEGETPELRNEYDIELDETLKPLREAFDKYRVQVNFIEGRGGKPEFFKDTDFHKLFFGAESLGVGSQEPFTPKVWPPYVKVPKERQNPLLPEKSLEQKLFDTAPKPIIFWETAKWGRRVKAWDPGDSKMLELVEQQYRMDKARSKLLAKVKEIATELKAAHRAQGRDVLEEMSKLAKDSGTALLPLKEVALLVENKNRTSTESASYVDYALPRGKIPFPREDMVKQLLALGDLKAPLKIEPKEKDQDKESAAHFKELNDLNASLFQPGLKVDKAKFGQLQVFTNKPRTVYYFALVTNVKEPNPFDYFAAVLPQALGKDTAHNTFVDQVQAEYGKEFLRVMVEQMRDEAGVALSDSAKKAQLEETTSSAAQ